MEKLAEDFGVSDEDQRKKIYYNLKDVLRKDGTQGNIDNWSQFFMWGLPFIALWIWFRLKYEKQITKGMKRYKKWQDARNPPPAPEPVISADGTNEWITGLNSDVTEKKPKAKKSPKSKDKKTKKAD